MPHLAQNKDKENTKYHRDPDKNPGMNQGARKGI